MIKQASAHAPMARASALNYKSVPKLLRHALFRCKLMTSSVAADRLSTEHEIDGFIDGEGRGVRCVEARFDHKTKGRPATM